MDIAREIGLSDVQVLNIEKGTRKPKKTTLKKLAATYEVSYDELRKLYYTDLFSEDEEERKIILEWAKEIQE